MARVLPAVCLLALVFAGAAAGQAATAQPSSTGSVPTTLYAHLTRPFQDFPMNTQEPKPSYIVSGNAGLSPSVGCLPPNPVLNLPHDLYTQYGYALPSLVDYDLENDGEPTIQAERGLAADIHLDPNTPMVLHWYWAGTVPAVGADVSVPTPNVVVQATMRAGDAISINNEAYDAGPILAQGQSAPALLAGPLSQGVDTDVVGGQVVYHFTIPLKVEVPVIPRAPGFNLKVETYVEDACAGGGRAMTSSLAMHSSPGHRPRLEFAAGNPLHLDDPHAETVQGGLVIHSAVSDAWGSYDIAATGLTVDGPGLHGAALEADPTGCASGVCADGPHREFWPQELTWSVTDHKSLPPGDYVLHLTAKTLQNGRQSWDVPLSIAPPQEAPGLPLAGLVAAVGLALAARRRP